MFVNMPPLLVSPSLQAVVPLIIGPRQAGAWSTFAPLDVLVWTSQPMSLKKKCRCHPDMRMTFVAPSLPPSLFWVWPKLQSTPSTVVILRSMSCCCPQQEATRFVYSSTLTMLQATRPPWLQPSPPRFQLLLHYLLPSAWVFSQSFCIDVLTVRGICLHYSLVCPFVLLQLQLRGKDRIPNCHMYPQRSLAPQDCTLIYTPRGSLQYI
jgi:hypothetical protein